MPVIGASLFLSILLPVPGDALTSGQVFDKVKDAVVVVRTIDAKGKMNAQGSGVLLSSGRVATNCHVVEGGAFYQVGRGNKFIPATLYAKDGDKDICLLDAKGIEGKPVQLGKAVSLKVGDPVYAIGAPQGLELSLSDGIVAQLRGGPPPLIQTTASISPGSSGGGLFDREGRLVGLTTLYLEGGQNLNFAMPVEWISEIKPGIRPVVEGRSQTEWLKRTTALRKLKDWQGMLDWCLKWAKSKHEEDSAWYCLGNAYGNLERYNDAIDAYRQAIRIVPEFAFAWRDLGNAYGNLERYNDAIDAYRQAIRIVPEFDSAWYNLGLTYFKLKRYDDAIDACRQAVRIEPENASAWLDLGNAYGNLKRYNDAIDAYRQSVRIEPKHTKAWYFLGITYAMSDNKTAALDAVRELRRLDPERADRLFNLIVPQ